MYIENMDEGGTKIDNPKGLEILSNTPERSPDSNFSLTLRFEKHQVNPQDYERRLGETYDMFRNAFVKGETNIFFQEESRESKWGNDKHEFVDRFERGFRKYHSFIKAYVYTQPSYVDRSTDSVTDSDYQAALKAIETAKASDPAQAYRFMAYEALDKLLAEDYEIQIMFEQGQERTPSPTVKTLDDVKKSTIQQVEYGKKRNVAIVDQIDFIEHLSQTMKQKVNLLALLGTHHSPLPELLPEAIQKNMTASSENIHDEITDSVGAKIMAKLGIGQEVTEQEWEEYGKQWPNIEHPG